MSTRCWKAEIFCCPAGVARHKLCSARVYNTNTSRYRCCCYDLLALSKSHFTAHDRDPTHPSPKHENRSDGTHGIITIIFVYVQPTNRKTMHKKHLKSTSANSHHIIMVSLPHRRSSSAGCCAIDCRTGQDSRHLVSSRLVWVPASSPSP